MAMRNQYQSSIIIFNHLHLFPINTNHTIIQNQKRIEGLNQFFLSFWGERIEAIGRLEGIIIEAINFSSLFGCSWNRFKVIFDFLKNYFWFLSNWIIEVWKYDVGSSNHSIFPDINMCNIFVFIWSYHLLGNRY